MTRKDTKVIQIGDRVIGGGNPILIRSMCNTKTGDMHATVEQIQRLEQAGCDVIHVVMPTMEATSALGDIKKEIHIPLVADTHFNYRLAVTTTENGADKIRVNPGNIGNRHRVQTVVDRARKHRVSIRVGVSSSSLEKPLLEKYGGVTAEGIVESALDKVKLIKGMGYDNLVTGVKSSDVLVHVKAHELIAMRAHYPLHVGITESGILMSDNIKSSVGLGIIPHEGIGGTIRVSLIGDPMEEIKNAKLILRTLGLKKGDIEMVSCPTCGRARIGSIGLTNQVENIVTEFDDLDVKVAVMGCVVNGPGEAREVDTDIIGGVGEGLLIRRSGIIRKVPESGLLAVLQEELLVMSREHRVQKEDEYMEKNFLETFPTLNIAESLREPLDLTQVEKVNTTRDRSSIRIYLKNARLIHKQNMYDLERGIRDQLFPDKQVAIKIQKEYRLSDQYTPKELLDVYKDSLLLKLKNYSIIEYTMFRKAGITFEKGDIMVLTVEDTMMNRDRTAELKRVIERVFAERYGLPVEMRFTFVEPQGGDRKKQIELKMEREA